MVNQSYKDWLLSLKEGDKVAINGATLAFSRNSYRIVEIIKITPTRIIKTSDNRTFNNDGYERGASSGWGRRLSIEPITDKVKDSIERDNYIRAIKDCKFDELTTEQLREIHWAITGGIN